MLKKNIMVLGEEETFLVRVLVKKIQDAGFNSCFVRLNVNDINANWDGTSLVTIYLDGNIKRHDDAIHYLIDKIMDEGKQIILVGEKNDIQYVCDDIPAGLIYKTFARPLDNELYIKTIKELLNKIKMGDLKNRILVVDDDPSYLGLVREWLKDNYKVAMVTSGLQAIKWLGKNKADLILLDYEMPVTSGPQVLEMLRSDKETQKIPVIFLTGKSDKDSVMAVMSLKPEGYFLKTMEREELLRKLKDFFVARKKS